MHTVFESDMIIRIIVAAILGGILGLERSFAGKHAGMRTYALMTMGSALFTVVGTGASYTLSIFSGINPLQIAGSIVVGIGFIGTGLAAMRSDRPAELTTASGVWVAAGIGMAVGFGLYGIAITATLLGVLIFSVFARLEHYLRTTFGSKQPE